MDLRWRAFLCLLVLLLLASCSGSPAIVQQRDVVYYNYADDFADLWERTHHRTLEDKRAVFRHEIIPLFEPFYGEARFRTKAFGNPTSEQIADFTDKRIDAAFYGFADIKTKYLMKVDQFEVSLRRGLSMFKSHFPDFETKTRIYLLHSLGEMDGGTRTLNGEQVLIFGADGMARFHNFEDESAFFLHELFHTYHEPRFGRCEEIWCDTWREGLAVYASRTMLPDATQAELLLELPVGMPGQVDERLPDALQHLKSVSGLNDQRVYQALFQTSHDETGLPPRRGYYLGYLILQEIDEELSLAELAELSPIQARAHFDEALMALLSRQDGNR